LKPESTKSFITNYISCLFERSRLEKQTIKFGIDWIIYNNGIAQNWRPIRLPFVRQVGEQSPKAKTETEFGIDVIFLTKDLKELVIFVLKDEQLNNKTWTNANIDTDLRKAVYPDLSDPVLKDIELVKIILTYNKDDDQAGIELFNRFTNSAPKNVTRSDKLEIPLIIERWNLDRLVDEVVDHLLIPQLLPQHISGILAYQCELVSRMEFGSKEWENLVIPTWKNLLSTALSNPIDERKLRAVQMSLIILKQFQNTSDPSSAAGWIDLLEWAMISMWDAFRKSTTEKEKAVVYDTWTQMYLVELELYINVSIGVITIQHGIVGQRRAFGYLNPINDAYKAFWLLARIGISSIAITEVIDSKTEKGRGLIQQYLNKYADALQKALRLNPAFLRPLLDVNHIELYFIWLIFWQTGRIEEIGYFLNELEARLFFRRVGNASIPFIEGRNQLDLVAEYAVTGEKPYGFTEESSYLLLMLIELCLSLPQNKREAVIEKYFNRLVNGFDPNGQRYIHKQFGNEVTPISLCWWSPPKDWADRIIKEPVKDGISVTFSDSFDHSKSGVELCEKFIKFIEVTRNQYPFESNIGLPLSVFLLSCIKHKSPLPSDFWRAQIFPGSCSEEEDVNKTPNNKS
jgi:hypothetical protein